MLLKEFITKGGHWLAFKNLGGHCGHPVQREEFISVVLSYFSELRREMQPENVDEEIEHWTQKSALVEIID